MATATFYTTAKRHNSTLVPTAGTDYDVVLKSGCDIITPTFYMQLNRVPNWSMLKFEGRYYFITGITSLRQDYWQIDADVDVLATYKSIIQNSTEFVIYASGTNTEIVDGRLSIKTTPTFSVTPGGTFPGIVQQNGTYVLTIVGRGGTDSGGNYLGGTTSYACTYDQMTSLLNSVANWANISMPYPDQEVDTVHQLKEAGDALIMSMRQLIATGHAGDNIKSCTYVPLGATPYSGKTTLKRAYMGDYDTGLYLPAITDRHYAVGLQLAIPWQASDWRRNAPYHELFLVVPSLGVISLSPSDLIDCTNIVVFLSIDLITGEAKIIVEGDARNRQIGIYGVNYGAQYPVGASNVTPMDLTTSILGAAATGITAATAGGAVAAAMGVNWLSGIMNNLQPTQTCVGGNGGAASLGADQNLWLYSIFHDTVVAPSSVSAIMGVPVMQPQSLTSQTGFVQTQNASVSGSMTDTERNRINSLMNGGIYIE